MYIAGFKELGFNDTQIDQMYFGDFCDFMDVASEMHKPKPRPQKISSLSELIGE